MDLEFKKVNRPVIRVKLGDEWVDYWDLWSTTEDFMGADMFNQFIFYNSAIEKFLIEQGIAAKTSRGGCYNQSIEKTESLLEELEEMRINWIKENE